MCIKEGELTANREMMRDSRSCRKRVRGQGMVALGTVRGLGMGRGICVCVCVGGGSGAYGID